MGGGGGGGDAGKLIITMVASIRRRGSVRGWTIYSYTVDIKL